jgi:ethanolamine utilization protein EutA (predicted chaperonin)
VILSGTIASTVQLQMLNNKWMQKKESGNVLSKQELNERSTWTSEQYMIADFQERLEHNREAEKRQKIDNKIMSGGSLSPEEISYLEKNDPVALKKYRETKEEKESYKEKLRQCKTKEEVDRVKLQKLGELESSLSSIVNDPVVGKQRVVTASLFIKQYSQ